MHVMIGESYCQVINIQEVLECGCTKDASTITEIFDFYKISKNRLRKIIHWLTQLGFIISIR